MTWSRRERFACIALFSIAASLRVLHLTWGLPGVLEEAMPLKVALGMIDPATGRVNPNPHFFNYPSLSIYLHLGVAQLVYAIGHLLGAWRSAAEYLLSYDLNPGPTLIAARLLHALADLGTVWAVWRLGRRIAPVVGWIATVLVAFAPVLLRTERTLIVDTLATCLLAWSAERLAAWLDSEAPRDLMWSAALIGLAASTKYPAAAVLPVMLGVVLVKRRRHGIGLAAAALAVGIAAFVLTSPFVVLDARAALRDILFERNHLAIGHFGSEQRVSAWFHLSSLAACLGPVGLIALLASPLAWRDTQLRRFLPWLAASFVVLVAPIVIVRYDAERYLAPAIPLACVIAAIGFAVAYQRVRERSWMGPALAAVLLAPVVAAGTRAAVAGAKDTQQLAREWCERHVPATALILKEGWSAPLVTPERKDAVAATSVYRRSGAGLRARFDAVPALQALDVPYHVTGTVTVPAGSHVRSVDAIDLNPSFYVPGLFAPADYVITSGAIRGRYEANPRRFERPLKLYELLDHYAERVATFTPNAAISGPEIRVYRIGERCRAELLRAPWSDAWWASWAGPVSPVSLRDEYRRFFAEPSERLAYASLAHGDTVTAERLTRAALAADPADASSAIVLSLCLGSRGAWSDAEQILKDQLGRHAGDPLLMLQLARVEKHLGRAEDQRRWLAEIERRAPRDSPVARAARRETESIAAR